MDITTLEVTLLYKNRWPVELFFKWVISYCLVAIVHHKMKLKTSFYNAIQAIGISLTDTTPLIDLFNKSNLSIDKELDGVYEPMLFDF